MPKEVLNVLKVTNKDVGTTSAHYCSDVFIANFEQIKHDIQHNNFIVFINNFEQESTYWEKGFRSKLS